MRAGATSAGRQAKLRREVSGSHKRRNEDRDAAVRGFILYPMNALVEDQLSRLRSALDSPDARDWFDQNRSGNRFYFGRYNSETPIAGHELSSPNNSGTQRPDRRRIDRLVNLLRRLKELLTRLANTTWKREELKLGISSHAWTGPKCVAVGICKTTRRTSSSATLACSASC